MTTGLTFAGEAQEQLAPEQDLPFANSSSPAEDLFLNSGDAFPGNPDEFPIGGLKGKTPSRGSPAPAEPEDLPVPPVPMVKPSVPTTPKAPVAPAARPEESMTEPQLIHQKLTARYSNPVIVRFVNNVPTEQVVRLYQEVSGLIDGRHIEPTTYSIRVKQAMKSLSLAVENKAFVEAMRLKLQPQQAKTFQQELVKLFDTRNVRTGNDSLQMMYAVMDLGSRQIGLKPSAVALEFVNGATDSLDKYSAFEPTEETRRPSADLEDHIVGIGVEIKPHDDGMLVVKALSGGPAAKVGLQGDDVITMIDGKSLKGKGLDYAVDLIKGTAGSRVTLGIVRDGKNLTATLTRQRVEIHSVSEFKMVGGDSKVGYIKLDKFSQNSSNEMDKALWALHREGMKSLIIDLRGNPGGLLTTAIELSDKFLPSGSIVSTRGRTQADNSAEYARYEQTWKTPLVVIVDENSASASEIFAAAIQENGRGLVVGRKSYGKGTVQTHFPLQTVSGNLRLTTAKFYSPNGRVMAGAGVSPDVQVALEELVKGSDRDLETAVNVAKSEQLSNMAADKSNSKTPATNRIGS
ncbi:MAG: S41 family peptidase [Planctomycetaceae bacterium]